MDGTTNPIGPTTAVRVGAVALGGAVGAVLRWGLDVVVAADGWPAATLVANLLGTFVLAVVAVRLGSSAWAVGIRVGVLGSFTTFSALAVQTVELADRPLAAAAYLAASLAGGLVAALLGLRLAAVGARR